MPDVSITWTISPAVRMRVTTREVLIAVVACTADALVFFRTRISSFAPSPASSTNSMRARPELWLIFEPWFRPTKIILLFEDGYVKPVITT